MLTRADITALILAGGQASRFNGKDKGLIEFRGSPMISHVINKLKPQVDHFLISANRNIEQYNAYGYPVIQDSINDLDKLQGPLAGLLQGMQQASTPWLLLSPCDTPFIDTDYCSRMIEALGNKQDHLVVATSEQRLQPLFALVPVSFEKQLKDSLSGKMYKAGQWMISMPHIKLEFSSREMFFNINSEEDMLQADITNG